MSTGKIFLSALFAISSLSLCGPASAETYDFKDPTIKTAKHIKKPSDERFFPKREREAGGPSPFTAVEYRAFVNALPDGAGTYDVKPDCSASAVKRTRVVVSEEYLNLFDIVFYNYHQADQARLSDSWPYPTAPFLEGDTYNPKRSKKDLQQDVARMFGISCLPTRVHFVREADGRLYEELREGGAAWEQTPQ